MDQKKQQNAQDMAAHDAARKECEHQAAMHGNRDASGVMQYPNCDCEQKAPQKK